MAELATMSTFVVVIPKENALQIAFPQLLQIVPETLAG